MQFQATNGQVQMMHFIQEIRKLDDVLHLNENEKIVDQKITPLTAPGENYGSVLLRADVTLATSKGNEKIYAVAKMPSANPLIQELFNSEQSFRNEIGFYKNIVPLLWNFQKQQGVEDLINFFPKYYGSRLNLNCDDSRVDSDAVLLLENLKVGKNYVTIERGQGFDLDTAKLILSDLARLHGVPIALKLNNRNIFDKEIKPFLAPWMVNKEFLTRARSHMDEVVENIPEVRPLKDRIHTGFSKILQPFGYRDLFATIVHCDCWSSNTMLRFENGEAVESKLVDFQCCVYGSPAQDVLFFLFSSVKTETLVRYYDDLVRFYHKELISVLEDFKCDVEPFRFENFEKELDFEAQHTQFGHIMFMLYPIHVSKEHVEAMDQQVPQNLFTSEPTDAHKKKLVFVVQEFAKRNWI